jgi:hypothetical protein
VAGSLGVGLFLYLGHKYFESALGTFRNIMKSMENKLNFGREVAEGVHSPPQLSYYNDFYQLLLMYLN